MESNSGIKQVKIDEKHLKDMMKESKKYNVPVAVIKTVNDEYKLFFKAEEEGLVHSMLEDLITKQLKDKSQVIDGITVEKSNTDDKISFNDEKGQSFIGSIKDRNGTIKGLQENLKLSPKEALKIYVEATKVQAKDLEITKSKRAGKVAFRDSKGREYITSLDGKRETVIKGLQNKFGLDEKAAEKLFEKAHKQNVKGKLKEAANNTKQQAREPKVKDKGKDKGDR